MSTTRVIWQNNPPINGVIDNTMARFMVPNHSTFSNSTDKTTPPDGEKPHDQRSGFRKKSKRKKVLYPI